MTLPTRCSRRCVDPHASCILHLSEACQESPSEFLILQSRHQLTLQDDYSRGYVFCDLALDHDQRTVIRALIVAMRQWQVIPKALLFDNGLPFRGMLLSTFCKKLGIRVIHMDVRHPQTNGKLERAFQDDMRDFYAQYDEWLLDHVRHDMPSYVHYRNYIRGHQALGGRPSITRLQEQTEQAPAHILDQLESYASYEVGRQTVKMDGSIRVLGSLPRLPALLAAQLHRSLEDAGRLLVRKMSGVLSANGCRKLTVALNTFCVYLRYPLPSPVCNSA